jgi:hypothetical protein
MGEPVSASGLRRLLSGAAIALLLVGAAHALGAGERKSAPFEPRTQVDGAVLQVIFGERALFRQDDGGLPVLDSVQKGQLAAAHPPGAASETFAPPGPGLLAAALDGSAEKKASVLKVWNHLDRPVQYSAMVLVLHDQALHPMAVKVCPIPAGAVRQQTWPAPIVAVGLSSFKTATKQDLARCAVAKQGK